MNKLKLCIYIETQLAPRVGVLGFESGIRKSNRNGEYSRRVKKNRDDRMDGHELKIQAVATSSIAAPVCSKI